MGLLDRSFASSFCAGKNSDRTGLPATKPVRGKYANAASKFTAAARTTRASNRFVRPGSAFCSSNIVG
jgi:hypothetical protein